MDSTLHCLFLLGSSLACLQTTPTHAPAYTLPQTFQPPAQPLSLFAAVPSTEALASSNVPRRAGESVHARGIEAWSCARLLISQHPLVQ
jgi:hypothetical protein